MDTHDSDKHCDSEFVGQISLGDTKKPQDIGLCQNDNHYIIAGIGRECVDNLAAFAGLKASSEKFHGSAKDLAGEGVIKKAKVRVYNGLCPMHLAGGKDARVLSEIDMKFDEAPESFDVLVEIIAKQTISQIKELFDADLELQEVLVDIEI